MYNVETYLVHFDKSTFNKMLVFIKILINIFNYQLIKAKVKIFITRQKKMNLGSLRRIEAIYIFFATEYKLFVKIFRAWLYSSLRLVIDPSTLGS